MNRVLIAEDSRSSGEYVRSFLLKNGYEADLAANGSIALDMFAQKEYPVVITDLEMPIMDGEHLIDRLKREKNPPVIFVMTANYEVERIVEIMKLGVYDYLRKPVDLNDLLIKLSHAFESVELKKTKIMIEHEKVARLEEQLSWYKWQEKSLSITNTDKGKTFFEDMNRAFNQSVGTGALICFLDMMITSAKKTDQGYLVEDEVFELLKNANASAKFSIDQMRSINEIHKKIPEKKHISFQEFSDLVAGEVAACKKFELIRNTPILFSSESSGGGEQIFVDLADIQKCVNELIMNALKFSVRDEAVHVIAKKEKNAIGVYILNEPVVDSLGNKGIDSGFLSMVFEPFYRLNKTVQEEYNTLDYGLGLTVADIIAKKNDAIVELSEVKSFADVSRGEVKKIMATIKIPFEQ